jgi:hypothetical protein
MKPKISLFIFAFVLSGYRCVFTVPHNIHDAVQTVASGSTDNIIKDQMEVRHAHHADISTEPVEPCQARSGDAAGFSGRLLCRPVNAVPVFG